MSMIIRNNIRYGSSIGGGNGDIVELTQEQYDALGDSVLTDNKTYYITDADDQYNASSVIFDNTDTNLNAGTVQSAIVEQNKNLSTNYIKSKYFPFIFQQTATGIMAVRRLPYVDIGIERSKIVGVSIVTDALGVYSATLGSSELIIHTYSGHNYDAETLNGCLVISYID